MAKGAWGRAPAQRDSEGAPAQLAHGRHPCRLHSDESRSRCTGALTQRFVQFLTLTEVQLLCTSCSSTSGFPHAGQDCTIETKSPSSVLYSVVCSALQEVLPTLLTVVGQHVRPVAPHLFTPAERGIMQRMTDLLLDHGATLALTGQDAVPVDSMPDVTLLSPPVHRLVLFKVRLLLQALHYRLQHA